MDYFELYDRSLNITDFNATFDQESDFDANNTNTTILYSTPSLFCGVVMVAVALTGVLGNIMTAIVFGLPRFSSPLAASCLTTSSSSAATKKKNSAMIVSTNLSTIGASKLSSISILVTGLAAADAVLLSVSCPLFAASAFMTYSPTLSMMNAVSYMTVYVYPLASTFQTVSVWTLSVITIERYVAVVHPFLARIVCTPSRAVLALVTILVVSSFYNAPRFWEYMVYRIEAADDPDVVLVIAVPTLRVDPRYMRIYGHWMYFVFMFALPFTILVVFNGSVVRCVRTARRRRQTLSRQQTKEQGTAVMMVLVALVFLACNLLAFLLNALEVFGVSGAHRLALPGDTTSETVRHSSTFYLLVDFNNLLVMTYCSINFFVYYNFSKRFRLGCYRLWTRFACFRLLCGRKLRAIASAAAAADAASGYETDVGHINQNGIAANLRRWSTNSRQSSIASVGNIGGDLTIDHANENVCRFYLQRVRVDKSTML